MSSTLRFVGWQFLSAGALGLLIAALWFGVHPGLAIFTGIASFIVLPALSGMAAEVRRRRATVILTYLAQAARLNLPLARMLDAAQRSEPKKTARRLQRLRDLLEDGAPLELALPAATPEVSPRAVALIASAERLGRLPQALERLAEEHRSPAGNEPSRDAFARWYPVLMSLAMFTLLALILVFVMPKFEEIFKDFGLRLPPATRALLQLGRGTFDNPFMPVLFVFMLVGVLGSAFRGTFGGARAGELKRVGVIDQVLWRLPVVHALQRDQGLADACGTIADGLRTGRSLPRAVDEAATLRVNGVLRGRLERWRDGLEEGMRADEAARRAGLPALVAGMIASGRGGDPAEAMEFLATYYEARFSRARELVRAASVPVLVLVFGGLVLFLVTGMYQPILNLMDHLSVEAMKVSK